MSATKIQNQKIAMWGCLFNVLGGFAVALAYLLHPHLSTPEIVSFRFWVLVHIIFMISLLAGLFALTIFFIKYLQTGPSTNGVVGFVLAACSLILIFGLDYAEVFIFPTLASEFPEVIVRYGDETMMPSLAFTFPATGIIFLIGYTMVGWHL